MIGHQWAENILKQHIVSQSVRHAYLFTGPDHVGKTTLAVQFARAVNCQSGSAGTACGECRSCRLIGELRHPDLHILEKEEGRTAIRIEQVRELQYSLSLAPYEAERRIALLPDVHEATYHAWNALLKTLEEPSDRVVLLLTAPSTDMLLPTIVSRCEVIPLRPVESELIAERLLEEGHDSERVATVSRLAMGSPGMAYAFLQNNELIEQQFSYRDDLLEWLGIGNYERLQKVENWMNWRSSFPRRQKEVSDLLNTWLALWRDIIHQLHGSSSQPIHTEVEPHIRAAAGGLEPGIALGQIRKVQEAREYIQANADPRLVLESLVLGLPYLQSFGLEK